MRDRSRWKAMAAVSVGMVLMMTGCSAAAPEGDELYQEAAARYFPMADGMHAVIMAVHPGEWAVDQGAFGAQGTSCQRGADDFGYFFDYARTATIDDLDGEALSDAASAAFAELGVEPTATVRGSGDAEEYVVIAEGESIGRAVVTIRPARGQVRVTARTECAPGSAHDLSALVFGEERLPSGVSRRLPAFEGPEWVPQFYFPADGPLYYGEDGEPVIPQPFVADPPTAPYGDPAS